MGVRSSLFRLAVIIILHSWRLLGIISDALMAVNFELDRKRVLDRTVGKIT